jgi:hypothetical protein
MVQGAMGLQGQPTAFRPLRGISDSEDGTLPAPRVNVYLSVLIVFGRKGLTF